MQITHGTLVLRDALASSIEPISQVNDTSSQDVFLLPVRTVKMEETQNRYGGRDQAFTGSGSQLQSYDVARRRKQTALPHIGGRGTGWCYMSCTYGRLRSIVGNYVDVCFA